MSDRIPMTRVGYDKLRADLEHLNTVELPIILDRVAAARAEGDLSENAEYQYGQEARMHMEARIRDLRDRLSRATLIDPSQMPRDEVAFGATVKLKDLDFGDEEVYTLVGSGEENYDDGKILFTSPIGQGLAGKKVGDKVSIEVPQGTVRFEVLDVGYGD